MILSAFLKCSCPRFKMFIPRAFQINLHSYQNVFPVTVKFLYNNSLCLMNSLWPSIKINRTFKHSLIILHTWSYYALIVALRVFRILRGYCTSGPYFWRFCAFSQKIKQLRTKYPMDLVRNVPRNSQITILLQCRPLLWSYSEKCAKFNIFHVLSHKSITTWVSETPVQ